MSKTTIKRLKAEHLRDQLLIGELRERITVLTQQREIMERRDKDQLWNYNQKSSECESLLHERDKHREEIFLLQKDRDKLLDHILKQSEANIKLMEYLPKKS